MIEPDCLLAACSHDLSNTLRKRSQSVSSRSAQIEHERSAISIPRLGEAVELIFRHEILLCSKSGAKSYGLASVTDSPPVACPWKRPAANESSAKVSLLWSRMISMSCSKVHLRLVKKFPGHPPAGAIVPSAAPGVDDSVMTQAPLAAASRQRPPRSIGGGLGGDGAGGEAAACSLGGDASCDVPVHAVAVASDSSSPAAIAL